MSLGRRAVTSISWNLGANLVKVLILLVRSILLARLLPVETFGVYALATAIVTFSGIVPQWGMAGAFLHRSPETADEERAAAVHFTLRLVTTSLWAAALILGALALAGNPLRTAIVVLTLAYASIYLTDTPRTLLGRRVQHRRLALLDLAAAAATTVVAVALAEAGYGLTSLLATDLVTGLVLAIGLYVWRPVWRPRLLWARDAIRYYLHFGSRTMTEAALTEALDTVDDLWIGAYLGNQALGLYSRAYAFATYPRRLLAMPVNAVAGGAYSELKGDRPRLSAAFAATNALLIRSGFLLGGLLILVAPEFTALLLGEKWLPMVPAFRLLAVFTLLDPLRATVSSLFTAVGRPEQVVRTRLVQLAALFAGLYALGTLWGITGVALVVDGVLLLGLGWLLMRSRDHVDFSAARLFGAPLAALAVGSAAGLGAAWLACHNGCPTLWLVGVAKAAAFAAGYAVVLLTLERNQVRAYAGLVQRR